MDVVITLFTMQDCATSRRLRTLLQCHGIVFTEICLVKHPTRRVEMTSYCNGDYRVPQLLVGHWFVQNLDDIIVQFGSSPLVEPAVLVDAIMRHAVLGEGAPEEAPAAPPPPPTLHDVMQNRAWRQLTSLKTIDLDQVTQNLRDRLSDRSSRRGESLSAPDIVEELCRTSLLPNREHGLVLAHHLHRIGAIRCSPPSRPFEYSPDCRCSVVEWRSTMHPRVLNLRFFSGWDSTIDPVALSGNLVQHMMRLFAKAFRLESVDLTPSSAADSNSAQSQPPPPPGGATMNVCRAVAADNELLEYERHTGQLHGVALYNLSPFALTATFVNLYNALLLHTLARRGGPPVSRREFDEVLDGFKYRVGDMAFTLNDMFDGVLRGNRGISGLRIRRRFGSNDPRRSLALTKPDPRILFALAPQHMSLATLTVITEDEMDMQLSSMVRQVVNDSNFVWLDQSTATFHLPAIFKRYRSDFGGSDKDVVGWAICFFTPDNLSAYIAATERGQIRAVYSA